VIDAGKLRNLIQRALPLSSEDDSKRTFKEIQQAIVDYGSLSRDHRLDL